MSTLKSTPEQLRSRGYLTGSEFASYRNDPEAVILQRLHGAIPHERTAAVRNMRVSRNDRYPAILSSLLEMEKQLYTRLEIANCLESYGEKSVPFLLPLLGRIGANRHADAAIVDIKKKSFPLPRDFAARILIRIGPVVFPALRELFLGCDRIKIQEAIDVAGHIAWNFRDVSMEDDLVLLLEKNGSDRMIAWKTIRAFRSFPSPRVAAILGSVHASSLDGVLQVEAERSLELLASRKAK